MKLIFTPLISLFLFTGCGVKPVACLSSDPTAGVNQVVYVQSCGMDADAYQWQVEGGGETIVSGGDYCDSFVRITFSTTGEKIVRLIAWKFKKKSNATCAEGLNSGKTDETTYTVKVE